MVIRHKHRIRWAVSKHPPHRLCGAIHGEIANLSCVQSDTSSIQASAKPCLPIPLRRGAFPAGDIANPLMPCGQQVLRNFLPACVIVRGHRRHACIVLASIK